MRSSRIEIASPCHESWDAMDGGAERRFCGVCQKDVHDLSAMRHDEVEALLQASSGTALCVRYTAEHDGSLRFRDLVPRASLTRKLVRVAFAATMLAACTPHGDGPPTQSLGEAVIESVRQDTVPTADGGCDYQSGPFTTVHLPPGHLLCKQNGDEVVQPPEFLMGKMPAPPPDEVPTMGEEANQEPPPRPEVPEMGVMVAEPDPVPPFVPCDPQPGFAPPPAEVPGEHLMGDIAPFAPRTPSSPKAKPAVEGHELMGLMIDE